MIKKIKKWFCTIIAAFAVIYAINVIYASWSVFKTLNGNNDDEMRYYEVTMYPNSGYEGIYVYAKTSLIYSYHKIWFLLKKEMGKFPYGMEDAYSREGEIFICNWRRLILRNTEKWLKKDIG